MRWTFRLTLDHPRLTLLACALLSLLVGGGVLRLKQDTAPESFLPRGDEAFEAKKFIDRTYDIHDAVVVALEDRQAPDVYNPEALALVRRVSDFVRDLPGVQSASVRSLATWKEIRGDAEGLELRSFVEPAPVTPADFAELRRRVAGFSLYEGLLVSHDGRSAYVIADVVDEVDVPALFHAVRAFADTQVDTRRFTVRLTGPPVISGTLNVYLNRDAYVLDPVAALVTMAFLWLLFRSGYALFWPFISVLPSILWALGFMGHAGARFTPFSNAIPVVVLCVALSDSIHLLGAYYEARLAEPALGDRERLELLLVRLWRPIAWTSLTTAAGFLALRYTSSVVPVQEFGVAVAVGALAEMLLTFYALPAALLLLRPSIPAQARRKAFIVRDGLVARALTRLHELGLRRPWLAALPLLLIALVSLGGLARLRIDYKPVEFFPRASAVFQDHERITSGFAGIHFVDLHLDSGRAEGVFEPAFLRRLGGLLKEIDAWPQVGKSLSLVPYLERLNQAMNADAPEFRRIADDAAANAQLFLTLAASADPSQIDELTAHEDRSAHVRIFLRSSAWSRNGAFLEWLGQRLPQVFEPGSFAIGGEAYVTHRSMRGLVLNVVVYSVLLVLLSMYAVGLVLLRDALAALFMILPVSLGILATFGVMGYMDVSLGLLTSIFASIAIGIGVDYAIHMLFHYRIARFRHGAHAPAALETLSVTGKLVLGNAATVVSGFLVITLAESVPPQQIGLFVAVGVLASLAATLLSLPILSRFLSTPRRDPVAEQGEPAHESLAAAAALD